MPTILFVNGYRIAIYMKDHEPAHVHVWSAEHQAILYLNCPIGPPALRINYGFNSRQLRAIFNILTDNLVAFCRAWKEIHV